MGFNGSGGYVRSENFSADSSASIKILATRMDTEFDDFASAMTLVLTRNGQNSPSNNINMAGYRFTNLGAAASAEDALRVKEFIKDIPIYVKDTTAGTSVIKVSAAFYVSVSAGQSPPDGSRLKVYVGNNKTLSTCSLWLFTPLNTSAGGQPHVAPVWTRGRKYDPLAIRGDRVYELAYDASASGWHCLNPSPSYFASEAAAKAVDNAGVVAGRASASVLVAYSRNGNQLVFSLLSSASVSCSTSAKYFIFSASGVTSQTSGVTTRHSIPVTVKDLVSQSWAAQVIAGQVNAQANFNAAGTTVSVGCTIRAAPFTALFI